MPTSLEVIDSIKQGKYDAVLCKLYGVEKLDIQKKRYCETISEFERYYGANREIRLYSAPGRTEIGGNHTDHNKGIVLAAAVDLDIIAISAKANSKIIRVKSRGFSSQDIIDASLLEPQVNEKGSSAALVRGVAAGIKKRGGEISGLDIYTASNVLRGSGLSSSAAFEVCIGNVINHEFNNARFTAVELGQIGQYAENVFFGKPSGLMDQTACAVGGAITIDFKDTEHPRVTSLDFNLAKSNHKLVITDTKGSHANLTAEYVAIAEEMQAVAKFFGKSVLREITEQMLLENIVQIRKKLGDRAVLRAIHFFNECRRVNMLFSAIENDDFDEFKRVIIESGHSSFEYNQNAYSYTKPTEQGVSLGLALSQKVLSGKGAWRLQGGGFAGTIQAFVPNGLLSAYCELLESVFGEKSCYVLSVRKYGAVEVKI